MPELPEVEQVRRSLMTSVAGCVVQRVTVRRGDVVSGSHDARAMLSRCRIDRIERRGKQLAVVGVPVDALSNAAGHPCRERCLCVHLGMTGSLRHHKAEQPTNDDAHVHVVWHLACGGRMTFRDPRRFGGIWTYPDLGELNTRRWSSLGEDALQITPGRLHALLARTHRPLKSALLDQSVLAGLGNIYIDELLFTSSIHPLRLASRLTITDVRTLVRHMRQLLQKAIKAGGSTLRDYVDGQGNAGAFQFAHRVYGRHNQPCVTCKHPLSMIRLSGRSTVFCPACQPG